MKPVIKRIIAAGCIVGILAMIPVTIGVAGKTYHEELKKSDELRIGVLGAPVTMDGQLAVDLLSTDYLSLCQGQLFVMKDGPDAEPELAESYEVSEDGCTYTFHLRDGIRYHDGTPITAEDFVYSWRRIADPDTGSQCVYNLTDCMSLKNAEEVISGQLPTEQLGVSAPDSKTFVVELNQPCPYLLPLISSAIFSPANEDFVERMGDLYCSSPETMLCSGAFVPDRYVPLDSELHYKKNPNYIFADDVSLSGITVRQVENPQQAMMNYQSGGYDIIQVSGETVDLAKGDPALLTVGSGNEYFYVLNGNRVTALKNPNLRHALCLSVDRESIVRNVLKQGFTPVYGLVPPEFANEQDGSDYCNAKEDYSEITGFDPVKAREYWETGLKEEGISSLNVEMVVREMKNSEPVVDSMEKVLPGLHIEVRQVTNQQFSEVVAATDYDILFGGWIADYPDPKSMLECMVYKSVMNGEAWLNEEFEHIIHTNCLETDPVKRMELLHKAEDLLMEDYTLIPYYFRSQNWLISDSIKGYSFSFRGSFPYCNNIRKESK